MKPKDAQRPDRHTTVFQITPPRAFRYDALVIAVGSVTNDFGTPGTSQYAVPLETPVQAMRFNRRLVNADESPTVIHGIRPPKVRFAPDSPLEGDGFDFRFRARKHLSRAFGGALPR